MSATRRRGAVRVGWSRALVTGASAGIGTALARELANRGVNLVLVARDFKRLELLASELRANGGVEIEVIPTDLADRESLTRLERRIADGPLVDVLVNNAGVGTFGAFEKANMEAELTTIDVNAIAPFKLTRAFLDRLGTDGHRGTVIAMSSMDALQPTPYHSTYGATKAFVNSFFAALHEELRGSGISVTTVMPGYVETEFVARAGLDGALEDVPSWLLLSPRRVAEATLDGAAAGKAFVVPGTHYKVAAAALSITPSFVGRKIFARLAPQR